MVWKNHNVVEFNDVQDEETLFKELFVSNWRKQSEEVAVSATSPDLFFPLLSLTKGQTPESNYITALLL